jgi:hypothetical protein
MPLASHSGQRTAAGEGRGASARRRILGTDHPTLTSEMPVSELATAHVRSTSTQWLAATGWGAAVPVHCIWGCRACSWYAAAHTLTLSGRLHSQRITSRAAPSLGLHYQCTSATHNTETPASGLRHVAHIHSGRRTAADIKPHEPAVPGSLAVLYAACQNPLQTRSQSRQTSAVAGC